MIYKILWLFLLFLLSHSQAAPVSAQSLSLTVSPPLFEIMIKPGRNVSLTFTITNLADDTLINTQIVPFDKSGLILDDLSRTVPWLQVVSPASSFVLKKGEEIKVIVNISPPEGTQEQDYYQALLFKSTPQPNLRGSQSNIQQSLAALIFASVTQTGLAKSAEISEFNLPVIIDSFSGFNIDISVKNTGKTYFYPNGNLLLKGPLGDIKYNVLPRIHLVDQERKILLEDIEENRISGFFLGKYNITAAFTLDEGTIGIKKEKVVYALPYKFISLFGAIFLIFKLIRKKRLHGKKTLHILFLAVLSLNIPRAAFSQEIIPKGLSVQAEIPFRSYIRIYGLTSPNSMVVAEGTRTFGQSVSNHTGNFIIDNLALSPEVQEICLHTIDKDQRISYPLCLPSLPVLNKKNLGPVILPPTLSLSHNYFHIGQNAFATGQSLPSSVISVFLFNSRSDSKIETLGVSTDENGKFNFKLPTNLNTGWRVYAAGSFEDNPIPKSHTLYFYVNTKTNIIISKILPILLWLITLIIICLMLYLYNYKTGNVSYFLLGLFEVWNLVNQKKLQPAVLNWRLKRKLLWYTVRESWRRSQK